MREKYHLHLGNKEIIAIIVRNGLFGGHWKRMRADMESGNLIFPGISLPLVENLQDFERKHQLNLNRVLFSDHYSYRTIAKGFYQKEDSVHRICYAICRGIFSYPCVAQDNRINTQDQEGSVCRTFLARPLYICRGDVALPIYKGVHRMLPNPEQFNSSSENDQDKLLEQLNRIRECFPCDDQNSCQDHQYVMQATQAVIREYQLENSFVGKLLARSLCWMTAEESRLMQLIEKEGPMIDGSHLNDDDEDHDDFFPNNENESFYSESSDPVSIPLEPHPLLDVLDDLRESIRDTIRLILQIKEREEKNS